MALKRIRDGIPEGWRRIKLSELEMYLERAKNLMNRWTIAKLSDGWRFSGGGYGFEIKKYGNEEITEHIIIQDSVEGK